MPADVAPRAWVLAERLYIHCHGSDEFLEMLRRCGVVYPGETYRDFGKIKTRYTFMSEDDLTFASFMQGVPFHRYSGVLEEVVFDECALRTRQDDWNYYGEAIKGWLPELVDLLKLSGFELDGATGRVRYTDVQDDATKACLLQHGYGDPFLDHIRDEINKAYEHDLFLSVMFLTRKLLEATFVRVAEAVFPKLTNGVYSAANHALWYDRSRNSYRSLDELIDAFRASSADFAEDRDLVAEYCSLAKPLKNETNKAVHADYKMPDATYVRQWRLPYVVDLGRRLFRKYCNP